jgi:hypothetical protein
MVGCAWRTLDCFSHKGYGGGRQGPLTKKPLAPSPNFFSPYALNRRRRRELVTTETELMAMAAAARAGLRVQPQRG